MIYCHRSSGLRLRGWSVPTDPENQGWELTCHHRSRRAPHDVQRRPTGCAQTQNLPAELRPTPGKSPIFLTNMLNSRPTGCARTQNHPAWRHPTAGTTPIFQTFLLNATPTRCAQTQNYPAWRNPTAGNTLTTHSLVECDTPQEMLKPRIFLEGGIENLGKPQHILHTCGIWNATNGQYNTASGDISSCFILSSSLKWQQLTLRKTWAQHRLASTPG